MKTKQIRKLTAMILALLMVFNFTALSVLADDTVPVTIAAWDYTAAPTVAAVPATSGALLAGSVLTNFKDATPTYSSSSLSINGWENGADTKYWQISLSTKDYDNLKLSAKTRSSGTGPRDFKVTYSIDNGSSWNDVPDSTYTITATAISNYMPTVLLPSDAADLDNLQIKFVMTSNISSRAGTSTYSATETVASGGTSNINNIIVAGIPIADTEPGTVADVTAVPGSGEVAIGTKIALSCSTDGAIIMYSINEGEDIEYDTTAQITLDTLPTSLKAYATKDGQPGDITTFNYEQAKVVVVTASPAAGAVNAGTEVSLSTATEGADIFYGIGDNAIETPYSGSITISEETTIKAIARKVGFSDSDEATFIYTIKAPVVEKTIAEARAAEVGSTVTVTGVVTWMDGTTKAYIQDETAAIVVDLYYITGTRPTLVIGDEVTATGDLIKYNGLLTIKLATAGDIIENSSDNALPEPKLITIANAKAGSYEAQLVKLNELTLGTIALSGSTPVTDAAEDTINIYRILLPTGVVSGDKINAIAIVSNHTSGYQLRIRSAEDVTKIMPPDTVSPIITHTPIIEGNTGINLNIKAVVTDDRQVSAVKLAYKTIGEATYKNSAMILSNGEYSYDIPMAELSIAGLVYYIEASDGTNTVTAPTDIEIPYSVTISEVDIVAPEILNLTPADGASTGANFKPVISADYNDASGIDTASVKLYLDGLEVTAQCTIDDHGITYTPTNELIQGEHTARLVVKDNATVANQAEVSWKFNVGEAEYNFYFGQLHSHTNISDGQGSLSDAYTWARDQGNANFFAVTDHSNWLDDEKNKANETITNIADATSSEWKQMHSIADSYNKDGEFVAIAGFEMTWSGSTGGWGHINTFNTPWFTSRSNSSMDLKTYYQKLMQNPNSLSQLNHPGKTFGDFGDFGFYSESADNVVNLIEVGNGEGPVRGSGYFPSYEYYTRALDKGWHLAPSNNQDNHKGNWITSNDARTVVLATTLTRESIFDAVHKMHVYSSEDKNLEIMYKINNNLMGSSLDETEKLNFNININDPESADEIAKVSIISNGGVVAASQTFNSNTASWAFELSPEYSYYYVKVEQADKDIAVTAPIWIGEVEKAGISNTISSTTLPLKGEKLSVTTNFFNNENSPMKIKSLEYTISGNVINVAPVIADVASLGTGSYSFEYTPLKAGEYNIDVRLVASINEVEKMFTDVLKLDVIDTAIVTKVVIDAYHSNDYVSGYYAGNMTNFITLANEEKINVILLKEKITDESLIGAKLLVLAPPAKKSGTANGNAYIASPYAADEIAAIKKFAEDGGNIIITGLADYQDNRNDSTNHTAYQQNLILEAIGAGSRINDDEVVDYENNPNANATTPGAYGTPYRIPMNVYNMDSQYLESVDQEQVYSFYSGCSITLGSDATWLVKGTPTTYGFNSDNDLLGGSYEASAGKVMPADTGIGKGNVFALATETLSGGGSLFVGGTVFYSNFEIKTELDNASQLQNSNYNITMNILDSIKKDIPITKINQVRSGEKDDTYCIQGRVTAESEAYTKANGRNNSFFEVLYVQDETGGITIFGVSEKEIPLGAEVKITGWIDEYEGDLELQIRNEASDVSVLSTDVQLIAPRAFNTATSMLEANEGILAIIQGKVTRKTENTLYVNDGSGEARVYVNGYIGNGTSDNSMLGKWDPAISVGDTISAIGLVSEDSEGHRLRVRNTAEIVRIHIQSGNDDDDTNKTPTHNSSNEKVTDQGIATITSDINGDLTVTYKLDNTKVGAQIENETSNIVKINASIDENAKSVKLQMESSLLEKANKNNKSLEINTGDATISIEPGALDIEEKSQVLLSVNKLSGEEAKVITSQLGAEGFNPAAYVFDFDLTSTLGNNTEKVKLNKPLTITIKYDSEKVTDLRKLGMYYYNETTNVWEYIGGKVTEEGTIEFIINHFSKYTAMEYNKTFKDIDIPWAKEAIEIMAAKHIIDGVIGGNFAPNDNVTKAQFTKMIVKALDLKAGNTKVKFTDVIQGAWYEEYVNIAASLGITEGSNGQFKPNEQITREAMAVMVVRAINLVSGTKDINILTLSDQNEISVWAKKAVAIAYSKGIINGTTNITFAPKDNATRAQAAVIIYRLMTYIESER